MKKQKGGWEHEERKQGNMTEQKSNSDLQDESLKQENARRECR